MEGPAQSPKPLKPINYLRIPTKVSNLHQAVQAMRVTDHLCSLTDNQQRGIKFAAQLKVSLIQVRDKQTDTKQCKTRKQNKTKEANKQATNNKKKGTKTNLSFLF